MKGGEGKAENRGGKYWKRETQMRVREWWKKGERKKGGE